MDNIKSKIKKGIKWVLLLALAFVLLYFAFRGVKWSDFAAGLKSCNFYWISLSMLLSFVAFWVRGMRWRLVMLPLNDKITVTEAYHGVTIAYFTNFALPRAGEFARCGVIAATGKASFQSVLGTVVLERSWDMLTYLIILLSVMFTGESAFGKFITEDILAPASDAFSFNILWLLAAIVVVGSVALYVLYRYRERLKRNPFFNKCFNIMKGLADGLISGFKMKHKGPFFLYTLLLWICYWGMSYTTILAFPQVEGLNGLDALFLMVVGSLGWIVPVQGGIGAYHFILSLAMMSIYNIPQTSGVVFATISHESQAFTMLVCGAVSTAILYVSKSGREKHIKNR